MRNTRKGDVTERFPKRYVVDEETGCWNWIGGINCNGYGIIGGLINGKSYAKKGSNILAHRVSWIIHNGEIPDSKDAHGTVVRHSCDNRKCVNPKHLVLGTQGDNVRDMDLKGRRKTVSKSGVDHWKSVFTQEQIDEICSTEGDTKILAEKFGASISAVKDVRRRNGFGSKDPDKYTSNKVTQEMIDHIRSTPPRTFGLAKLYGISNTAISKIRKGLSYK